jgi:hypothetical protein
VHNHNENAQEVRSVWSVTMTVTDGVILQRSGIASDRDTAIDQARAALSAYSTYDIAVVTIQLYPLIA